MIRPLRDNVLVARSPKSEMFNSFLHVPPEHQKKVWEGEVVAVGKAVASVGVGDTILTDRFVGIQVPHGETEHLMIPLADIVAVVEADNG